MKTHLSRDTDKTLIGVSDIMFSIRRLPASLFALMMLCAVSGASAEETRQPNSGQDPASRRQDNTPVVLVVGASGSIGRPVVSEALRKGYETRALVRDLDQTRLFPKGVKVILGDLTKADTLHSALEGVTAVIFTHGISGNDPRGAELVNYGAVKNVLSVLDKPAHIVLMTTVGVTKPSVGHDWKRRGERLVRASGLPYTIVRPGWFDYNGKNEHKLVMRQGDTHWSGSPADGAISREQLALVLVDAITSPSANRKTFELVAVNGTVQSGIDPVYAALTSDEPGNDDGPGDQDTLPASKEPQSVKDNLSAVRGRFNL